MYTSFLRNCYTRISQILIIIAMCDGLFLEIPIQVYLSKPKVAGSIPTVVRLIFQLAWCGIYTQSNNTLQIINRICMPHF